MIRYLFIIILIQLSLNLVAQDLDLKQSLSCKNNFDPVCGMNGQTYKNRCEANLSNMLVQSSGACDVNSCPEIIAPVCVSNVTYNNMCLAEADGHTEFLEGACNVRSCTGIYAPVCGKNNKTFLNACVAERAGINIIYAGLCETQGNNCSNQYAPVCGIDKKTYDNRCFLDNAKIQLAYAGVCLGEANQSQ
jgi:hypothetical protein